MHHFLGRLTMAKDHLPVSILNFCSKEWHVSNRIQFRLAQKNMAVSRSYFYEKKNKFLQLKAYRFKAISTCCLKQGEPFFSCAHFTHILETLDKILQFLAIFCSPFCILLGSVSTKQRIARTTHTNGICESFDNPLRLSCESMGQQKKRLSF